MEEECSAEGGSDRTTQGQQAAPPRRIACLPAGSCTAAAGSAEALKVQEQVGLSSAAKQTRLKQEEDYDDHHMKTISGVKEERTHTQRGGEEVKQRSDALRKQIKPTGVAPTTTMIAPERERGVTEGETRLGRQRK